jgi:hypothetical protein
MKEIASVVLDYDYDFYKMTPSLDSLRHGEYIKFTNDFNEKICEVWSIHSSLILFGFHRDDCFGVKFAIECHHSSSDITKMYPQIQKEFEWFNEEYCR